MIVLNIGDILKINIYQKKVKINNMWVDNCGNI